MSGITIGEMKKMNEEAGHSWFSEGNLKMFGTKIVAPPNRKGLFITSEYVGPGEEERAYTIRHFDKETGHVNTVNEFLQYKSLKVARWERDQI